MASRGAKGSAASGTGSRAFVQRPLRRDRMAARRTRGGLLRRALGYAPFVFKLAVAIAAGALMFLGYRAVVSASLFRVRDVEVAGTSRISADQIRTRVRRAVAGTGVWRANLSAISAELEHLPAVRSAVVSRVLPDGLRVRITERAPVAVVRTSAGHFIWVDADAVALGEMKPADDAPPFFIRGWNEDPTDEARAENLERIETYLGMEREWSAAGLSERVSEVNLIDVRDVRAQLAGADSQIEVRLGEGLPLRGPEDHDQAAWERAREKALQDLGKRLKQALQVLDYQRQTPRGALITYIDLTQGKRAIVAFSSGGQVASDARDDAEMAPEPDDASKESRVSTLKRSAQRGDKARSGNVGKDRGERQAQLPAPPAKREQ